MKSLNEFEDEFEEMRLLGIDTNEEIRYQYLFSNEDQKGLEELRAVLKKMNFEPTGIQKDSDHLYKLYLSKVDIHDAHSFHKLNLYLEEIATTYKLTSYVGYRINKSAYMVIDKFKAGHSSLNKKLKSQLINIGLDGLVDKNKFNYLIELKISYSIHDAMEYPNGDDLIEMGEFEGFVKRHLRRNGIATYFLGRSTHRGLRRSYYSVKGKSKSNAIVELESIQKAPNKRAFEFSIIEDIEWTQYDQLKTEVGTGRKIY